MVGCLGRGGSQGRGGKGPVEGLGDAGEAGLLCTVA
jgi:hypothetical protein